VKAVRAILVVLLAAGVLGAEEGERNLVPNGDFEEGEKGATKIPGWTEVDGLTTFLESAPGRGRVLRIDTDVLLAEANARWKEMELPPLHRPPAKPKGPTVEPKYDTVGGTTGAKVYSDYIRVEPGMRYRLKADVKSDGPVVMIFVKGYAKHEGGFRKFYQCYKNVKPATGEWATWERTFNPTAKSPKVTHIRVMPYAYWPPGQAWIDNIEVTRVGKDDPGPAKPGDNLLPNGDFEAKRLAPWSVTGSVYREERGGEGVARIAAGGALTSGRVPVEADRPYLLTIRARPAGAVLTATIEGGMEFGGKWASLFTTSQTLPPDAEDPVEIEVPFHPTAETPQVTDVILRLSVSGAGGDVVVEDVSISPAKADGE
jgi:hypothetical protein